MTTTTVQSHRDVLACMVDLRIRLVAGLVPREAAPGTATVEEEQSARRRATAGGSEIGHEAPRRVTSPGRKIPQPRENSLTSAPTSPGPAHRRISCDPESTETTDMCE